MIAQAGATLTGAVTQSGSATAVTGTMVSVTDGAGTLTSPPTGSDGAYTVEGLEAGPVTVTASAPGYDESRPAELVGGRRRTDPVRHPPSWWRTVSSPAPSRPRPAGTLTGASVDAELVSGGSILSGTVNSDGTYSITDLPTGSYTVAAGASGDGPAQQTSVPVAAGAITAAVDLQLTDTPATVSAW